MSKNPKIPENYQTVMPYLILNGADKFINFAKNVFDAVETHKSMRDENIVMHAEIMIGESTIMFADSTKDHPGRSSGFFIYVDDANQTYKKAIDAGATKVSELSDQVYGRSGGVLDPFGNTWWITSVQ